MAEDRIKTASDGTLTQEDVQDCADWFHRATVPGLRRLLDAETSEAADKKVTDIVRKAT